MSLYNQEYNKDNVVLRYIVVATLAELKKILYYYNLVDDERVRVDIPFYYSTTGEERFLQDNFLYDTVDQGKAIGDYEVVPRGILQLQGFSINTDEMTNKYVSAKYIRQCSDGIVRTFVADTNFIPITLNFDVNIVVTNTLEILKVSEAIISKLYKTRSFYVDLGMCTMQAAMVIPEDLSEEKPFEFQVDTKKEYNITFSIEVKSFIPVLPRGISFNQIVECIEKFVQKHIVNQEGKSDYLKYGHKNVADVLTLRFDGEKFAVCANGIIEEFSENLYTVEDALEVVPPTTNTGQKEIEYTYNETRTVSSE